MAVLVGVQVSHAQQTNEAEKKGRVTLLQRLILGAGAEKVAIDTPQSVSVVDQEDIEQDIPTTVSDVIKTIPGINLSGSERVLGQTFNIRGVGGPESGGEEGRIIVNIDGVNKFYEQYRMGGLFTDMELYKRVEVLRGPASSTLYGAGALGGVVNFTTKDASDFIAEGQTGAVRLKGTYDSNPNGW
ncbi:MAG: TonB-dependent receptor plug domain-containing protein, partial [Mesorhizobium sp.]|nr:TonB-dependent receptor plug domain-containing protein [Mesorhizobium sp.]